MATIRQSKTAKPSPGDIEKLFKLLHTGTAYYERDDYKKLGDQIDRLKMKLMKNPELKRLMAARERIRQHGNESHDRLKNKIANARRKYLLKGACDEVLRELQELVATVNKL